MACLHPSGTDVSFQTGFRTTPVRPDLTQVETSDIKTHVFPAGRSPGGAAASAHPECERFPVVSVRKGRVPGQGRRNNFLPLWAPKSWGCCL